MRALLFNVSFLILEYPLLQLFVQHLQLLLLQIALRHARFCLGRRLERLLELLLHLGQLDRLFGHFRHKVLYHGLLFLNLVNEFFVMGLWNAYLGFGAFFSFGLDYPSYALLVGQASSGGSDDGVLLTCGDTSMLGVL